MPLCLPFADAAVSPELLDALQKVDVEDVLLPVLLQLAVLILVARLFAS
jgi:hypothetical protein